ncbi:hypothetical protein ABEP17_09465 [Priestia flexa]|uniref:hypothetical protein n=1 Tax=Priestia flexa TaxID=86664 RepID=UPI003D26D148
MSNFEIALDKIQGLLEYVFVTVSSLRQNNEFIINLMIEKEKKEFDFGELTEEEIRHEFNEDEKELIQKSKDIIKTLNKLSEIFTLNEFKDQIYQMDDIKSVKTGLILLDKVTDEIYSGEILNLEEIKDETDDIEGKERLEILIENLEFLIGKIIDFTVFCSVNLNIDLEDNEDDI